MKKSVCVIGAGPSGMGIACQYSQLINSGHISELDLKIYEKQDISGGLWNLTWLTGASPNGEPVHGSMYKNLWSNGPKEGLEFPDYTFKEHFGRAIPSFPPREVLLDYLRGRWKKYSAERFVEYEKIIKNVSYDSQTKKFTVCIYDIQTDELFSKEFDYVVNATGHFSSLHLPTFAGIESFPGRILHSHDFRSIEEFKNKTVLIVGASYSAEDIALQCHKFGVERVVCSYRSKPMAFKWPANIVERPLLLKIDGRTCFFKDGSSEDFDAIIFATGYIHTYPWMQNELRISCREPNTYFVDNLYKGILWTKGGGDKLLYMGAQDQLYTFTLFDIQANWVIKYIAGLISLPTKENMIQDWMEWKEKLKTKVKSFDDEAWFQLSYMKDLVGESEYPHELDCNDLFIQWHHSKDKSILAYRDDQYESIYTKKKSPLHHTPWILAHDSSLSTYLNGTK
uniref:Flavin-containing monooxygenase n=1 Tax=Caligus rogercresseyi TaxID=217165 RepID=C1BP67_CALRO|nr:Thiol-specific monooxygenase [Caligus rogercresseyi]